MSMGFVKSAYIKEISGGNKMFKKLKDKKGFTLVELIVVLVILAILAALLVPALTGYIDKANNQAIIAKTRSLVMAAQTLESEAYGKAKTNVDGTVTYSHPKPEDVGTLAEVTDGSIDVTYDTGKVKTLVYTDGTGRKCTFENNEYKAEKGTSTVTVSGATSGNLKASA